MKIRHFATKAQRHKIRCMPLCLCAPARQGQLMTFVVTMVCIGAGGFVAMSQSPSKKIKEFSTQEVNKVSLDRLGNFYLVLKKGVVKKYDTDGNFMDEFSNPEAYPITLVDPWNPLRVFV